jgi:hypothetical protein
MMILKKEDFPLGIYGEFKTLPNNRMTPEASSAIKTRIRSGPGGQPFRIDQFATYV